MHRSARFHRTRATTAFAIPQHYDAWDDKRHLRQVQPDLCPGNTAEITDITYEGFRILSPSWWAVDWAATTTRATECARPQVCTRLSDQSTLPDSRLRPISNLLLKDVLIEQPALAPGVLLWNASQPMNNVTFDNVVVKYTSASSTSLTPRSCHPFQTHTRWPM